MAHICYRPIADLTAAKSAEHLLPAQRVQNARRIRGRSGNRHVIAASLLRHRGVVRRHADQECGMIDTAYRLEAATSADE